MKQDGGDLGRSVRPFSALPDAWKGLEGLTDGDQAGSLGGLLRPALGGGDDGDVSLSGYLALDADLTEVVVADQVFALDTAGQALEGARPGAAFFVVDPRPAFRRRRWAQRRPRLARFDRAALELARAPEIRIDEVIGGRDEGDGAAPKSVLPRIGRDVPGSLRDALITDALRRSVPALTEDLGVWFHAQVSGSGDWGIVYRPDTMQGLNNLVALTIEKGGTEVGYFVIQHALFGPAREFFVWTGAPPFEGDWDIVGTKFVPLPDVVEAFETGETWVATAGAFDVVAPLAARAGATTWALGRPEGTAGFATRVELPAPGGAPSIDTFFGKMSLQTDVATVMEWWVLPSSLDDGLLEIRRDFPLEARTTAALPDASGLFPHTALVLRKVESFLPSE